MKYSLQLFLALLGLGCASQFIWAQSVTLTGSVWDPSRGAIPGANITVTNVNSSVARSGTTDESGSYRFTAISPGIYSIRVEAAGFRPELRERVEFNVGQAGQLDFVLQLPTSGAAISVTAETPSIGSESAAVSTVIDRKFIENLPLNGRSFQTLIATVPGVVMTKATFGEQGQFSVNGQRANANYFTIDGVSANIGVSSGLTLVQSASGSLPGLGANGGTNTLVSVEALQEFRVLTSSYSAEYGRTPGAQVTILTRSGTNQFHGSLFHFFRNNALDANDWFANANGLPRAALRQNDFGGVLGGPIRKNRTFFFFSYEGLRLRQPQVRSSDVPALWTRAEAPAALRPYLNSFPLPNREETRFGFAPFVASYSNSDTLNATSARIDHAFGNALTVFGRFNIAPSLSTQRLAAMSHPSDTTGRTTTLTLGATVLPAPRFSIEGRLNYSRSSGETIVRQDTFGGAVPLSEDAFPPGFHSSNALLGFFLYGGVSSSWYWGKNARNEQGQWNGVGTGTYLAGKHAFKFGIDYRRTATWNGPREYNQFAYFQGAVGAASGRASQVIIEAQDPGTINFVNLSTFVQDAWRVTPSVTVTYGTRWEINPAPFGGSDHPLYTFENSEQPRNLRLAPVGTSLYETQWNNFAPRFGIAWRARPSVTIRAGFGLFYDLGSGLIGQAASSFPYYRQTGLYDGVSYPLPPTAVQPPPFTTTPPVASIYGAERQLKLPLTHQWNLAIEKELGSNVSLVLTGVGAAGRRLLRMDYFINPNNDFTYAYLLRNTSFSNFNSLQAQLIKRLSKGWQIQASYSLAHSLDNASTDSASHLSAIIVNPERDYGASDFDIRHTLSTAFTAALPHAKRRVLKQLTNSWSLDGVFTLRTATPVDITYTRDLGYGTYSFRPDVLSGRSGYVADPLAPGGKRFDVDAFALPASYPGRQGTLGRNVLRGFGLNQLNLTVRREFPIGERLRLQFRSELFNVLNHPTFADPLGSLQSPQFGLSTNMLGQSLGRGGVNGGLNPLYQLGGPRSTQLALRLVF